MYFSKIRAAFNNAYRRIFGLSNRSSASGMYANYNIFNFEAILREFYIYNCIQRIENEFDCPSTDAVLVPEI